MIYALEYKQLFIPREEMTKNRTCQSFRWKQYALSEDEKALKTIMESKKDPWNWRIELLACNHAGGDAH